MNLYAESSAVLSWLLGEEDGATVREHMESAEGVFSSELTLVECRRVLVRLVALGEAKEAAVADRRAELDGMAAHWNRLRVTDAVLERAQRPFPDEPVRTLDTLHLASALVLREAQPGLTLLSLDRRVRRAGVGLGFEAVPASAGADS